jgi:hypothetical protein
MTAFSNNSLPNLTTLVIYNQTFTESKNNSFLSLIHVNLTSVPINITTNITFNPLKLTNITLIDNTFDLTTRLNLKYYANLQLFTTSKQ